MSKLIGIARTNAILYSGHLRFRKLRAASIVVIAALSVTLPDAAIANAQETLSSANPEQLAAAIARTMAATNPATTPDFSIVQKISSHGNVVETHNTSKDAKAFAKLYADRAGYKDGMTRNMCKPERRPFIQKGVIFHYVADGPGASSSFDFYIDEKACASLSNPTLSAAPTTARNFQNIAARVSAMLSKEPMTGGLQYEKTIVLDTGIEITEIVKSPELANSIKAKEFQFRGITQGWVCGKFESEIRSGVHIHFIYKSEAGSTILEFPIDGSVC